MKPAFNTLAVAAVLSLTTSEALPWSWRRKSVSCFPKFGGIVLNLNTSIKLANNITYCAAFCILMHSIDNKWRDTDQKISTHVII